jgi:hypothetical protein
MAWKDLVEAGKKISEAAARELAHHSSLDSHLLLIGYHVAHNDRDGTWKHACEVIIIGHRAPLFQNGLIDDLLPQTMWGFLHCPSPFVNAWRTVFEAHRNDTQVLTTVLAHARDSDLNIAVIDQLMMNHIQYDARQHVLWGGILLRAHVEHSERDLVPRIRAQLELAASASNADSVGGAINDLAVDFAWFERVKIGKMLHRDEVEVLERVRNVDAHLELIGYFVAQDSLPRAWMHASWVFVLGSSNVFFKKYVIDDLMPSAARRLPGKDWPFAAAWTNVFDAYRHNATILRSILKHARHPALGRVALDRVLAIEPHPSASVYLDYAEQLLVWSAPSALFEEQLDAARHAPDAPNHHFRIAELAMRFAHSATLQKLS